MIICPKCGYDNELGRIFCTGCSERLDLSQVKSPQQLKKMHKKMTPVKFIRLAINVVIFVFLVAVGYSTWQAPSVKSIKYDVDDLESAKEKFVRFEETARTGDKLFRPITLSESEVAAYMDDKTKYPSSDSGFNLAVKQVRLQFEFDELTVVVTATANVTTYKHDYVFVFRGPATVKDGAFVFTPRSITIGKCTVPKFLFGFVSTKYAQMSDVYNTILTAAAKQTEMKIEKEKVTISPLK